MAGASRRSGLREQYSQFILQLGTATRYGLCPTVQTGRAALPTLAVLPPLICNPT